MPFLAPSFWFQPFSTQTTATTDTDVSGSLRILGSFFEGFDWLVFYRANIGGNDASQVGEVKCVSTDGVTLGLAVAESNGGSVHYGGGQLQGFARITTPSGGHTVKQQFRNITSSDTCYIGSAAIAMVPLNQPERDDGFGTILPGAALNEGSDFFYSGTNSSTAEVSGVGNTWTTVRTENFTLQTAGDYRVLFSVETQMSSGSATDGHQARFQIDGVTLGAEWVKEWENNSDRPNFAYSDVQNLSAGSHTFRIQVQNRNANSVLSAYRSRIWALRADTFPQGAFSSNTAGDSAITHTSYSDAESVLSTTWTPSEVSYAAILATVNLGGSAAAAGAVAELRMQSGSGFCVDAGSGHNDSGLGSDDDLMPTVLCAMVQTGTQTWLVRHRVDSGTGTIGRNAGNTAGVRNNLQIWPLFVRMDDPTVVIGNDINTTLPR